MSTLVLFVSSLLADDQQVVEDEERPSMALTESRTTAQVKHFGHGNSQHQVSLGCGQLL